ncbi:MAG TPA: molybdopterin molybdenumtransferase MoeA, partial [Chromatiales bacterium]|nr:molybdopterin molybdenumtransferase MoeA [Chromatiales bacterium]
MPTIPVSPSCCDEVAPGTLSVEQARQHIRALITPVADTLTLELTGALDHVLAEAVTSPLDVPPHRNSAMDGYAVRAADLPQQDT